MRKEPVYVVGHPRPPVPVSPAIRWGNILFTAGMVGRDPITGEIPSDIRRQTRQCLENLLSVVQAAGSSFGYVLKATVFLVDMDEWPAMNEVYAEYFSSEPPARSSIGVTALARPEARIEIELVAAIPNDGAA